VASDLPFAWIRQAASDFRSAEYSVGIQDACQAIAKYQQVVEKSVKAIAEGFYDRKLSSGPMRAGHDVDRLISTLLSVRLRKSNVKLAQRITGLFNEPRRDQIRSICRLAPNRPAAGQLQARNTEYPFQNSDGTWRAPADPGSFGRPEVDRFRQLAHDLGDGARRIVSTIYRSRK
jgi:HEPN domain-containing protein